MVDIGELAASLSKSLTFSQFFSLSEKADYSLKSRIPLTEAGNTSRPPTSGKSVKATQLWPPNPPDRELSSRNY